MLNLRFWRLLPRSQRASRLAWRIFCPIPVMSVWNGMTVMRLIVDVLDRSAITPVETPTNQIGVVITFFRRRIGVSHGWQTGPGHVSLQQRSEASRMPVV